MILDPYLKLLRKQAAQDMRTRAVNGFEWGELEELDAACALIMADENVLEAVVYDGLFLHDIEIEALRLREDALKRLESLDELLAYGRALNKVLVQFEVIRAHQKTREQQLTEVN